MKKFVRMVDWRKFSNLTYGGFIVLLMLYLVSLATGRNVFPENVWTAFGVVVAWPTLLLVSTFSEYLMFLYKNQKRQT